MKIALYFLSLFSLSQAAGLVRWSAAPPDVIGFWRLLAAALLLLPLAVRTGALKTLWAARRREMPVIALSSVFFFAHLWTYFYAAQNTRIAHCMILFATNPLWTALGNRLFFGEPFTRRLLVSYVFAAAGIFLLVHHSVSFETGLVAGDLMALLSAVVFAGYLLTGKRARRATGNSGYTVVLYALAGLLFGLSGLIRGVPFVGFTATTWLAIGATVLLPTLLGHALFTWLMNFMNINLMSCGKLIEPVFAAIVAAFVFGEAITPEVQLAFACTAASVLILFLPHLRRASA